MLNLEQKLYHNVPTVVCANEPHMALVFLLDTSSSMTGDPIRNLNAGLNRFKLELSENKQTRDILDVAIIAFNSSWSVIQEFCPIEYMGTIDLVASGGTVMSPAIRKGLELVNDRSRFYRRAGAEPYKPWVIMISDGAGEDVTEVAEEIKRMENAGKVSFRSLGVGAYDSKTLHKLSGPKVMKLEGADFTHFFDWVNKSIVSFSQSSPNEKVKAVDLTGNVTVDRNTDWD